MDTQSARAVRLGVLGPVRASVDGGPVDLGGPRQRAVLTRLVVEHGRVVSTDRLQDDLWAGEPPPTALAALQVHISHLRRALEPDRAPRHPARVIVSAVPGYAVDLPPEGVDAWEFESLLVTAAAAGSDRERHRLLTGALDLWRGDAYAEVADEARAAAEVARLTELHLTAVEFHAAADLALARPLPAVAALERLIGEHPDREEGARLLALALYRSGRQGDSLAVLRRIRQHLADELGLDPGPALRALEADVLAQAPALFGPERVRAGPVIEAAAEPGAQAPPGKVFGRDREFVVIRAAATAVVEARAPRVVWVSGEAGEGKSTLVEGAAEQLTATGWRVAWGRCPEVDGAPPGWAWHEVGEMLGLCGGPEDTSPFGLARAVGRHLAGVVETAPVLVVLEDAHRGDSLTLQVMRQVVDTLEGAPVLLVVTFRASEAPVGLVGARAAVAGRSETSASAAILRVSVMPPACDRSGWATAIPACRTGRNS